MIKVICAWCGKELGKRAGKDVEGESHSICDKCLFYNFPEIFREIYGNISLEELKSKKED